MKLLSSLTLSLHILIPALLTLLLPVSGNSYPKCTLTSAPAEAPSPYPRAFLPGYYAQGPTQQSPEQILDRLESESKIRNKLALYPLAIAGKNFSAFADVFTADAVVDFSAAVGVVRGLASIEETTEEATANVDVQIAQGTQLIKVDEDNPCTASTIVYFAATYYGTGENEGKSVVIQGEYRDGWIKDVMGEWYIQVRLIQYAGFPVGDLPVPGDGSSP